MTEGIILVAAAVHLLVIVAVFVQSLRSVDIYAKYEQQCQMTCLERDVDNLRADFWDWKFLRYQICSLFDDDDCIEPYVITMDNVAEKYMLYLQLNKSSTQEFEIKSKQPGNFQKLRKPKSGDISGKVFADIRLELISNESPRMPLYFFIEHRYTRFYDLSNFNIKQSQEDISFYISSNYTLQEKYVFNFFTLFVIEMNYKSNGRDCWFANASDKIEAVSIGTNIVDQRNIILTEGSRLCSWCSTFGCIWLYLVILYFVRKMIIAVHGYTETFSLKFKDMRNIDLTKPDVIRVGSGDLNIFTSYFFSYLLGNRAFLSHVPFFRRKKFLLREGFCRVFCFLISFAFWVFIQAYFDISSECIIFSKASFLCILIICIVSYFSLFPSTVVFLICVLLILSAPELLTYVNSIDLHYYGSQYILVLLFAIGGSLNIPFYGKICVKDFLFPVNPFQSRFQYLLPVFLRIVQIFKFLFLIILGLIFIRDGLILERYDANCLTVLFYWLFFLVIFALITFGSGYKRVTFLVVEVIFTALSVAHLMNVPLQWLYQALKLMDPKQIQYLYIMFVLHIIMYLVKINRDWYTAYDTFLTDVVTHVRNKYKCSENNDILETGYDCIALIHNHIDDNSSECKYTALKSKQIETRESDSFKRKGLILLINGSNEYVPSDFFFEVIKLPGAPGPIKTVILRELFTLVFLRLFPALFIYWLSTIMYHIDFEKYDAVIKVIIGSAFISQYKELFFYSKISLVDVKNNIAFQRQIQKFLDSYESCFVVCDEN